MKKLILPIFLLLSIPALAQKWETIKIDSFVSVSLPEQNTMKDSAGMKLFNARTLYGNISVHVLPDSTKVVPDIEKKKHLERYYDRYSKSLSTSVRGKITQEVDTLVGDLHVKDFMLETNDQNGHLFRKFRLLHENCETYVFQYIYDSRQQGVGGEEQAQFFNSIRVANNPGVASQFTSEEAVPKKKTSYVLWLGVGVALFSAFVAVVFSRRKKRAKKSE